MDGYIEMTISWKEGASALEPSIYNDMINQMLTKIADKSYNESTNYFNEIQNKRDFRNIE